LSEPNAQDRLQTISLLKKFHSQRSKIVTDLLVRILNGSAELEPGVQNRETSILSKIDFLQTSRKAWQEFLDNQLSSAVMAARGGKVTAWLEISGYPRSGVGVDVSEVRASM
jgi:hypothetical protein